MFSDYKQSDILRPRSQPANDRVDNLISAIGTLRAEAYRAPARERPALDRTLYLLTLKLSEAMAIANPHCANGVGYNELAPAIECGIEELARTLP